MNLLVGVRVSVQGCPRDVRIQPLPPVQTLNNAYGLIPTRKDFTGPCLGMMFVFFCFFP